MNFQGKIAFITGASSGIGHEFSKQLHELGAKVVLCARRIENLNRLADELNSIRPESASILEADLSDELGMNQAAQYCASNNIDILVNNAGRGSFGYFESIDIESEIKMVRLNVDATMRLANAVIPQMKKRRSGVIISVSSICAFQPIPYMATYSATKAFNLFHSMALRAELSRFGVKVLTVCPGPTTTEFGQAAKFPSSKTDLVHSDDVRHVVSQSLLALRLGFAFIVPGFRSRLMSLASRILPKSLTTWITERGLRHLVS